MSKQFKRTRPVKHEAVIEFDEIEFDVGEPPAQMWAGRLQVPRPSIARLRAAVPASAGVRS